MAFVFEAEIDAVIPSEQVNQFAMDHGCNSTFLKAVGDTKNPVYKFTSTSYDCLEELVYQIYGHEFEFAADVINEV